MKLKSHFFQLMPVEKNADTYEKTMRTLKGVWICIFWC